MTSKERSWGRHAQGSRWERRREGRGRGWGAQRCSTRVQVHRAGRSTFAWRAKGTAWIFILTVERGCQVWEKKGGRETGFVRRQHPSSPSLLHLSVSVSFARKPRQPLSIPPLPSLPLSDSTLFPPALSSFSPVSRAVVLYVWPPCVSWSLGPSLFCTSRCQTWRRRGREREGRVVNPRDPFQSSVSTIVVVFTDARFSEETSSIDASRRVRTDESWWLRTRLEWISKRIRVEWSSVLFMGCTTVNKVFGKSWDAEI